jgi:serine/threonine protein kinase
VTSAVPPPVGAVAQYNLLEPLASAGPGALFRARDTRLGRTVAVRLMQPDFAPQVESRARIISEARARIAHSHPNIITLFDAGEHDGRVYFAFEFARGRSLRAEMAGRTMNVRRALEIAIQISDAVAQVHAAGFGHRGLSPESVIVTEKGHAKIAAFPLASLVGFDPARGGLELVDCESPEETRGDVPDERSDVYSAGVIAYEMLTNRRPPPRGASAPSAWSRNVPRELDDLVLKALAPNPMSRCQSAAALAAELRLVAERLNARGALEDEDEPVVATASSSRPLVVVGIVIVVVALVVVWWLMRG